MGISHDQSEQIGRDLRGGMNGSPPFSSLNKGAGAMF
jgi:hypothetical protein